MKTWNGDRLSVDAEAVAKARKWSRQQFHTMQVVYMGEITKDEFDRAIDRLVAAVPALLEIAEKARAYIDAVDAEEAAVAAALVGGRPGESEATQARTTALAALREALG